MVRANGRAYSVIFAAIDPVVVSLVTALGTIGLGVLTYYRGRAADKTTATVHSIEVAFSGYGSLVDNLQEESIRHAQELANCLARCSACEESRRKDRHEIKNLKIEIGVAKKVIDRLTEQVNEMKGNPGGPIPGG